METRRHLRHQFAQRRRRHLRRQCRSNLRAVFHHRGSERERQPQHLSTAWRRHSALRREPRMGKELVPTREVTNPIVALVAIDTTVKLFAMNPVHDFGENRLFGAHSGSRAWAVLEKHAKRSPNQSHRSSCVNTSYSNPFKQRRLAQPDDSDQIEASTDLEEWIPIGQTNSTSGTATFDDAASPGARARFYRAVLH